MEILVELLLEVGLQVFFELLGDAGVRTFKKDRLGNPYLAFFGYMLLGVLFGALSLLVFDSSFISDESLRVFNLIITPVLVGALMAWIGKLMAKRGKGRIRLEKFLYGWVFAFSFALMRYFLVG